MAYNPPLEEIQQMLAGMKSHGEVLAAGPVSGIPQYPNPEVGDKYLNTNDNVFQECRVPRRWTGGFYQSSRIGSVYTLRSTGMAFIRAPSGWQPYADFLAALGGFLGHDAGVFTVADITALKTFGAPQPPGHVVSVISADFPGFPPGIPTIYQWKNDYDSNPFGNQDGGFPNVVVPNTVWAGDKIGAWINILSLNPGPPGVFDAHLLYPMPLDTNPPPPEHPEENGFFLTGPGHASPILAGFWDNEAMEWIFDGPASSESVYESGQQSFTWVRRTDPNAWALQADILFLNGIYRNSGEIGGAGLTSVYVVHDGADGDWAGHEGEFAWLDGDGATWLFDGGAGYEDQPAGIVNFLLQVQVEIHLGKILIPYVRNVNVNEWIPQIAGLSVSNLPNSLVGPSPLELIAGLRNNPLQGVYGRQVVEVYITDPGFLDSMSVTNGTRIDGDTGPGSDQSWLKFLADGNGDFTLEFAKAAGGVLAGVVLIGGVSYDLDLDFDVP